MHNGASHIWERAASGGFEIPHEPGDRVHSVLMSRLHAIFPPNDATGVWLGIGEFIKESKVPLQFQFLPTFFEYGVLFKSADPAGRDGQIRK